MGRWLSNYWMPFLKRLYLSIQILPEKIGSFHVLNALKNLRNYLKNSERLAQIPVEKEHMLHHSLDPIKSFDYQNKTKRVLHATVVKQLEIAALMENLQDSKFHVSSAQVVYKNLMHEFKLFSAMIEDAEEYQSIYGYPPHMATHTHSTAAA